jgi:hypothetical protein
MTTAVSPHDLNDPLSPEAFLGPVDNAGSVDWVEEVKANSESWGRYELVFDESTGQYELKEVAATMVEAAAVEAPASSPETLILLDAVADDCAFELAGWASLAGPTGPSAFHTPFHWTQNLATPADLCAVAALSQSRFGATWRLVAAA